MKKNIYFVITIDTEADHTADWTKSSPLTFNSVTDAVPNRLEPIFNRYGAVPTYLLAVEVMEDENACCVMKHLKSKHELGAHLHPEYVMPDKKHQEYAGTYATKFSTNYDPEVEKKKIESLTALFKKRFGYAPASYRGGKFGFGDTTAAALLSCGYTVDTSVTPRVSWENLGGADFRSFPDQPYFIDNNNNGRALLEVPVTINYLNVFEKILKRPTWLRPSYSRTDCIKKLIRDVMVRYEKNSTIVLNMMFHSMEFYPEASPYAKTKEECKQLMHKTEEIIKHCSDLGVKFCKLSDLCSVYKDNSKISRETRAVK